MAASCRLTAMDLLARRDHSRRELWQKLQRYDFSEDDVEQTLDDLTDERLLDDERYAEAYVRLRAEKGFGPVRIAQELKERGVSADVVSAYVRDGEQDWFALALAAYDKKYADRPIGDYNERAKRARFLGTRGFGFDTINRVLDEIQH